MGVLVERFHLFCKDILFIIESFVGRVQDLFFLNDELTIFGYSCIFLVVSFLFVGLLLFVREKLQLR